MQIYPAQMSRIRREQANTLYYLYRNLLQKQNQAYKL
jgi:hypothetical protein